MQTCVTEKTQKLEEAKRLEEQIQNDKVHAEELEKRVSWLTGCFESERDLGLAIYQLIRPENEKFVSVMPYLWNGHVKKLLENEEEVELEGAELTETRE